MFIQGLFSETYPQIAEYGNKQHIPLNIRSEIRSGMDGSFIEGFLYDCVEKVKGPVNKAIIIQTIIDSQYTEEQKAYIMTNMGNQDDPIVKAYLEFITKITKEVEDSGYID